MKFTLAVSGSTPETLRDSINESLLEIQRGLDRALVGEVIRYTGPGTYRHNLGVVPIMALVAGDSTALPISALPRSPMEWNEKFVVMDNFTYTNFAEFLLIGML